MLRKAGMRLITVRPQRSMGRKPIRDYFLAVREAQPRRA
jgi:hypothetical protein